MHKSFIHSILAVAAVAVGIAVGTYALAKVSSASSAATTSAA